MEQGGASSHCAVTMIHLCGTAYIPQVFVCDFKGTLLTLCCVQVMSEKLLTWNLAVRDFHILVNLVKVLSMFTLGASHEWVNPYSNT